jgi:hypothetical protein
MLAQSDRVAFSALGEIEDLFRDQLRRGVGPIFQAQGA